VTQKASAFASRKSAQIKRFGTGLRDGGSELLHQGYKTMTQRLPRMVGGAAKMASGLAHKSTDWLSSLFGRHAASPGTSQPSKPSVSHAAGQHLGLTAHAAKSLLPALHPLHHDHKPSHGGLHGPLNPAQILGRAGGLALPHHALPKGLSSHAILHAIKPSHHAHSAHSHPHLALQRSGHGAHPDVDPSALRAGLLKSSSGIAPDSNLRSRLGGHLGFDPGGARLHTGAAAAQAARSLNAEAFTIGKDVFFGAGRFDPASPKGMGLIAHELTHVGQQTGTIGSKARFFTERGGDEMEQEAQKTADLVMSNVGYAQSFFVEEYARHYECADAPSLSQSDQQRLDTISKMAMADVEHLLWRGQIRGRVVLDDVQVDVDLDLSRMSDAEAAQVWAEAIAIAVGQSPALQNRGGLDSVGMPVVQRSVASWLEGKAHAVAEEYRHGKQVTASYLQSGRQVAINAYHRTEQVASNVYHHGRQAAMDAYHRGRQVVTRVYNGGKQAAINAYHRGKQMAVNAYHRGRQAAINAYHRAKQTAVNVYNGGKRAMINAYHQGKQGAINAYHRVKQTALSVYQRGKTLAVNTYRRGKTFAINTYQRGKQAATNLYHRGKQSVMNAYHGVKKFTVNAYHKGKKAAIEAYHSAKQQVAEKILESLGVVKGVALEITNLADAVLWLEHLKSRMPYLEQSVILKAVHATGVNLPFSDAMLLKGLKFSNDVVLGSSPEEDVDKFGLHDQFQKWGLFPASDKSMRLGDAVGNLFDSGADKLGNFMGVDRNENDQVILSSYEVGELKGAIGTQVGLAFTGVEEVQLGINALQAVSGVEGVAD
ncbi:MAG: DUF4157 domain-containing protein, partial [Armatimonadota bacterium]|nr:DUF4157 domain-containing protein [Armatimonadota bacterium]